MEYAIVQINGKQYKITPDCDLELEHINQKAGEKINLDQVLLIADGEDIQIGTPYIEGASFEAEIISQDKGPKIHIRRFRAKSRHRRHIGFRSQITKVSLKKTTESKPKAKVGTKVEKKAPVKTSVKKTAKKAAK